MSLSDGGAPTEYDLDRFVNEAVRILREGFISEVAVDRLLEMGLTDSEVSTVMAKAQEIAQVRVARDREVETERLRRSHRLGLILLALGVVGTAGTYVLAAKFGFPTYVVFLGLIAAGIWEMSR